VVNRILDVATSLGASVARLGLGSRVGELGPRPEKLLELYEFEGCPFCRKVREALSLLDLEAMVYPCPGKGPRFRPGVVERGGKSQFPYLVDPNTGDAMYESDDIIRHLYARYGSGKPPLSLTAGPLTMLGSSLATACRPVQGMRYKASNPPELPLELWSYEASPFCRIVRELLCSLEIPYHLHNVAKGSPERPGFVERSGKMMVPYLVDPNTGNELFESAEIVAYLRETYAR
jgi:glutathione S-transferase